MARLDSAPSITATAETAIPPSPQVKITLIAGRVRIAFEQMGSTAPIPKTRDDEIAIGAMRPLHCHVSMAFPSNLEFDILRVISMAKDVIVELEYPDRSRFAYTLFTNGLLVEDGLVSIAMVPR